MWWAGAFIYNILKTNMVIWSNQNPWCISSKVWNMFQYKYKNWKLSVKNHILWLALWRKIYEKEKVHSSSQKKKKTIQLCLGHYPLTAITLILIMKILILPSFMNNKKGRSWVEGKEMGSKELDERFCHVAKCTCMISRELWKCSSIFLCA